ncbi:MAG: hypothetical protein IRZ21_03165 [Thermoleophilaceae bacterium]|nr:hypothetical protein [Thermoleophilaceae bacterium]
MWICFVDESGDPGVLPSAPAKGDPSALLVLMAVAIRADDLRLVTRRLLELKSKWPHVRGYSSRVLDRIDCDLKGSSLRSGWRANAPVATQQLAAAVTEGVVSLLEEFRTPLFGKVFVKHRRRHVHSQTAARTRRSVRCSAGHEARTLNLDPETWGAELASELAVTAPVPDVQGHDFRVDPDDLPF